jgi:hypothetical protein
MTAPRFCTCPVVARTHKMWLLPDASLVVLDRFHADWIRDNRFFLEEKLGLKVPAFPPNQEQPVRLWAIGQGFVRLRYDLRRGDLVVEADAGKWTQAHAAVVGEVILANAVDIQVANVRLLDRDANVAWSASIPCQDPDRLRRGLKDLEATRTVANPL